MLYEVITQGALPVPEETLPIRQEARSPLP